MNMKRFLLQAVLWLGAVCVTPAQGRLETYPAPDGADLNTDFSVQVRRAGEDWQPVAVYAVPVARPVGFSRRTEKASMAYFDFEGEVEIQVTCNREDVREARVRPLSYDIVPNRAGRVLTFCLNRPRNLSVEVNGDEYHNLHLFANPTDVNKPKKTKQRNLIYFGPGLHHLPGDTLNVPSGHTVYVAGGAVVVGCIRAVDARDVNILGRGIVRPAASAGVCVIRSKHVQVEGIITTQCPTGGSDSVTISNVKSITHYGWGDGMNVFASNNVRIDGVFCRNSDDCTTVYGTRLGFYGACRNITMLNSTLWADVAHPIFIGIHGDEAKPETLDNLTYKNIDILAHREQQIDYQGCMAINVGDNNLVRRVRFEDIRVEAIDRGQLLNLRVWYNEKYCKAPGRGIDDVLFKNVSYTGPDPEISVIEGYSPERAVRNIRFENLRINGTVIADDMKGKPGYYKTADMTRFFVGNHVSGVTFKQ